MKKFFILWLSLFINVNIYAYDFEVDGIYYGYDSESQSAYVTYGDKKYSGSVVIPSSVSYNGRSMKVTRIGEKAFQDCRELISIVIPNTITYIGNYAFKNNHSKLLRTLIFDDGEEIISYYFEASGTTEGTPIERHIYADSVYIGRPSFNHKFGVNFDNAKVMSISNYVKGKYYVNTPELKTVYISNPSPDDIEVIFSGATFVNATLYVPIGSKEKYMKAETWKNFFLIKEMDVDMMWRGKIGAQNSDDPGVQKCSKPSISYKKGKLTFKTDTEGAICHSAITDADIKSYKTNEVQLGVTYNISVYATKAGYANSETVTATLCWIDVDPKTEGLINNVANVRANAVLVQSENGMIVVEGTDDGSVISVYKLDGTLAGSATTRNNRATINTNLPSDSIAIVKVGSKSIKVVLR